MSVRSQLTLLLALFFTVSPTVFATETDQFTVPKHPLHDIGPQLSRKVVKIIESDRSGEDPERILHEWVGHNVLSSRIVKWVRDLRTDDDPVTFRPNVLHSIYRKPASPLLVSFLFDSPTIRAHGFYLGTDKLDHFFQQGYDYYESVMRKQAEEVDTATAIAAAVARGVEQEHTYFGTLASGVYSNADLAANFAGMKFYMNLRQPVQIGDRILPPLFEPSPEGWRLRPGIDPEHLLEPYFSDHFDESLNPSRYRFNRRSIRTAVRHRCDRWLHFYADRLDLVAPSGQSFATTWHGENYGHWLPPKNEISIATECDVSID